MFLYTSLGKELINWERLLSKNLHHSSSWHLGFKNEVCVFFFYHSDFLCQFQWPGFNIVNFPCFNSEVANSTRERERERERVRSMVFLPGL